MSETVAYDADRLEASRQAMDSLRMVRFHKHQFNLWLNGDEHWLIMGRDYSSADVPEDIIKKLRNAAWYRATTVQVVVYPDRMWVKATEPGQGTKLPSRPYRSTESRLDSVEKENARLVSALNAVLQEVTDLRAKIQELEDRLGKVEP